MSENVKAEEKMSIFRESYEVRNMKYDQQIIFYEQKNIDTRS